MNEEIFADYIIRKISLNCGGDKRSVKQYQFTGWPDHGVPVAATALLQFQQLVRAGDYDRTGPLLVHCR